MSQAKQVLCYLSITVGQCAAQGRTKRFCGAATKSRAELGTEHSEQKGKSSDVGWGAGRSAGP